MIYLPILGAFLEASGMTIEKLLMRKKAFNYKNMTVLGFLAIILVMFPFVFFFWKIDIEAYKLKNILIFAFIIATSVIANLLTYYSLKRKNLSIMEPVRLMQPLFTILLAITIFPGERNFTIIILSLIASISLVFSHIKKHHFVYDKYIMAALIGSLFFSIELVASKFILQYYNSFTFYFVRCVFIFLITLIILRPKTGIDNKSKLLLLLTGTIWAVYRVIMYFGYEKYGIVFTTILFILAPVFVLFSSVIFLKEKITIRQIISTIIIVACVIAAVLLG